MSVKRKVRGMRCYKVLYRQIRSVSFTGTGHEWELNLFLDVFVILKILEHKDFFENPIENSETV